MNIPNIGRTDSYKFSHFLQYPPDVTRTSSYIEPRKGGRRNDGIVFFGLQMYLRYLVANPITMDQISVVEEMALAHGEPFNREGFEKIVKDFNGYWPVRIYAIPEGSVVEAGTPLVRVDSLPGFPWVPAFLETKLLRSIWYPTTVATLSRKCKETIYNGLKLSSDDPDGQIPFKLHDFGARGVSSGESAEIGGLAHLVNFMGTDTFEALFAARTYYNCPMAGFSIPAAEHSTITAWGKSREREAYENMVDQFGRPGSIFAVVSDSYDLYNAVHDLWGNQLRQKVLDCGGTLVVRPDSGDPVDVPIKTIEMLMDIFGFSINSKGYKVLIPPVRLIQGDGLNPERIRDIVGGLLVRGISIDNIAFGMGGALLQGVGRDDLRFAMKTSAVGDDLSWTPVAKKPATDPCKASKSGRQSAAYDAEGGIMPYRLEDGETEDCAGVSFAMRMVYDCGMAHLDTSLDEIRARAKVS